VEKREHILQQQKGYRLDNREDILEQKKEHAASFALFNTYGYQLTIEEDARETVEGYLEVKCAHSECRKYFIPTNKQVHNRIQALNGNIPGESRLYCSENCKESCSLYQQRKYPKGFKNSNTIKRSFPAEFRNMVLERDNHQCVICGSTDNLTVHHSDPFATCKMFENDMDGAFTLCEEHDKNAHSISGCTLPELRKASQEMLKELQERGINLNEVPDWAINKYLKPSQPPTIREKPND
jgi:5-methylcytosine-specific restriction endonuclease McrA